MANTLSIGSSVSIVLGPVTDSDDAPVTGGTATYSLADSTGAEVLDGSLTDEGEGLYSAIMATDDLVAYETYVLTVVLEKDGNQLTKRLDCLASYDEGASCC